MRRVAIHKTATIVSFIVFVLLFGLFVDGSRKMARYQAAALTSVAPGPEMLNGSYDTMITTFAATTTR